MSAAVSPIEGTAIWDADTVDVLNLELARARLRVKRAETSLNHAKEMLDEECGVGINLALCDRIRSEKKRVAEARKRLMKIASTASA
ncbi:hypothetical protein LB515_01385 [Mesorhizobium sp. CA15]|uniref:hypothetical protein n=1 Tax=Mesorhizobium sp. CA15 TaxID=2876641 RepID=UPI001CD088CA|nr:hypothetical protein [Mesorhizobium sp. CA15]MBZ9864017.1 hypothetical protein [Mesorhizobium sp. CA15]